MKRKIYHVVKHGDEWQVRREGARRPTSRHLTKECAIDWARTLLALSIEDVDEAILGDTLHVLLKYQADIEKAAKELTSSPPT